MRLPCSRSDVVFPPGELPPGYVARREEEAHWADREIRGQTFAILGGNYCGRCLQVCPAPFDADGKSRRVRRPASGSARAVLSESGRDASWPAGGGGEEPVTGAESRSTGRPAGGSEEPVAGAESRSAGWSTAGAETPAPEGR